MEQFIAFTTYDLPITYKSLVIHPVRMKEYFPFIFFSQVLVLEKNNVPDPNVISMSYLEYLFHANSDETNYVAMLDSILRLVLRDKNLKATYGRDNKGKVAFSIGEEVFYSEDLDKIMEIIFEQNLIEPPNEMIQLEIRKKLEEAKRLRNRDKGKPASIEDLIISLMISSPMKLEDIYELTIRKFMKTIKRIDAKLHYEIYTTAKASGLVKFKDESVIKHWLSNLDENDLEGLVGIEKVESNINPVKN